MDHAVPEKGAGHQTPPTRGFRVAAVWGALASQGQALRWGGLAGTLLLSFWSGMGPHWEFPYPLHVDEWFHMGYAQGILDSGSLQYPNPYRAELISYQGEMGFQLLLASVKSVTGLSWLGVQQVAPGAVLALLSLFVYAFGGRGGFGWPAALLVPLIPTSIRTLGPAFLVPVTLGMLFIALLLVVLDRMGKGDQERSLWLVLVLAGGTLFVHPPSEAFVTVLVVSTLAAMVLTALLEGRYREGGKLIVALGIRMVLPVAVLLVWLPSTAISIAAESLAASGAHSLRDLGLQLGFLAAFGWVGVALAIGGLTAFIGRGEHGCLSYVLPGFTVGLLAFLLVFYPRYQLGPNILYDRGWSFLGLFLVLFAGHGLATYYRMAPALARRLTARVRSPVRQLGMAACWLGGVGVVVGAFLTGPLNTQGRASYANYYHVAALENVTDFRWLGDYLPPGALVALGEPGMAWAYPPVAGPDRRAFAAAAAPYSSPEADRLRLFIADRRADTDWLRAQGVAVFFTCFPASGECAKLANDDLFEVKEGVYFVPPPGATGER